METKKSSAQKVIEVAYERWTLIKGSTRGFGKISVFWIGDRSWEMHAYESWSLTTGSKKRR